MSAAQDPYRPPQDTTAVWHFDRSGVGQRLIEILAISAGSACLGQFIGQTFFPRLRSGNGFNLLMVLVPVIALTIWFALKTASMWKRADDFTTEAGERLDSETTGNGWPSSSDP